RNVGVGRPSNELVAIESTLVDIIHHREGQARPTMACDTHCCAVETVEGAPVAKEKEAETWPLTLAEAIRIGLDNSEAGRVVRLGGMGCVGGQAPALNPIEPGVRPQPPIPSDLARCEGADSLLIARVDRQVPVTQFRSDVLAMVRSIHQQYW